MSIAKRLGLRIRDGAGLVGSRNDHRLLGYGLSRSRDGDDAAHHGERGGACFRARANIVGLRRFEKDYFLNIGVKAKEADYLNEWNREREHLIERLADLESIRRSIKTRRMSPP